MELVRIWSKMEMEVEMERPSFSVVTNTYII